jgi:HK97 family phage portal protein
MASSLNAKNKPSWPVRQFRKIIARIDPEIFSQERDFSFTRYGITKGVGGKFGEIDSNQFAIYRPGGGNHIDPAKALANNRGYVYAAVNAIAREVMNIDWRLFQVSGKDHEEQTEHDALDLLDSVNDNMTGPELKYLLSAHLDLTGNAYWYLEGVGSDLDKPKAIYPMDPARVRPVLDTRTWPYQLLGYKMKLENKEIVFKPYEVIHFRLPDPGNMHEGLGPVQAGAEFIDNDNYAMEFNRKFFTNGARPSGFLESEMVSETQIEALKIGFANMHEGIDNMQRIAILPKGVKWTSAGSTPKDMDFKNLSENMRDRILSVFGVSKTILGTAESDTNRATAETADYVFSKRVIKPRMQLICSFLNERLIPRYGDDLYLSFLDPVPEDRAARTTEMQVAIGSQPVLTVDEARDEFMGLGPVEGGDVLMKPNTMGEANAPAQAESDPTKKPPAANNDDEEDDEEDDKKAFPKIKAANGQRVAFRPVRTKLQTRAKSRNDIGKALGEKIKKILEDAANHPTKKFETTKELDEAAFKEFSERTIKAENEIKETVRRINAEQKERVLANLPHATKAIDPEKLFNLSEWIGITTDALTPTFESLFEHEAKTALAAVGKPDLNPFSETAKNALHESIAKLSTSYETTVRQNLEKVLNEGLEQGQPLSELSKAVGEVYDAANDYGAERLAKTEAFRTSNMALKSAWQQSGVVKTVKWYTSSGSPCPFCLNLDGKVVSVDSNFLDFGQTMTVGDGEDAKTYTADYGEISTPPLHPNCMCFVRPEDVSI